MKKIISEKYKKAQIATEVECRKCGKELTKLDKIKSEGAFLCEKCFSLYGRPQ
jgi:formylmethanofuran dehydrogenase subunit E